MIHPLVHVRSGDPLRIPAAAYNAFADAALAHRQGLLNQGGYGPVHQREILFRIKSVHLLVGSAPNEQMWLYNVEQVRRLVRADATSPVAYELVDGGFVSDPDEKRTWMINLWETTHTDDQENVDGEGSIEVGGVTYTRAPGILRRRPLPIDAIVPGVLRTAEAFTAPECCRANPVIAYCPEEEEPE